MTDGNSFDLSRRKVLGSITTIGAASAVAGSGTLAQTDDYYSDEENFTDNELTAGSLDLKVDWQASYNGEPTSAFPDTDNDNEQDEILTREEIAEDITGDSVDDLDSLDDDVRDDVEEEFRAQFADVPDELPSPLINVNDVKPGDEGSVSYSLHLFDNPGYIWMTGEETANAENGMTEAEENADDPNPDAGELADAVETTIWYDENCNNEIDGGEDGDGEPVDVVLTLDESVSIDDNELSAIRSAAEGFVNLLADSDQAASVAFASNAELQQELTTDRQEVINAINQDLNLGTTTNLTDALDISQTELESDRARDDADPIILVLSDGEPDNSTAAVDSANAAKQAGSRIVTLGFGLQTANDPDDARETLQEIAGTTPGEPSAEGDFFEAPEVEDLEQVFADIGGAIGVGGEEIIFEGSLADALELLSQDPGLPLDGDRETEFAEAEDTDGDDVLDTVASGDNEDREPFENSTTQCIGFQWELPTDVGNEIQTDSVMFDIGFFAEQARSNSGAGS